VTESLLTAIKQAYDDSPLPAFLEGLFHIEAPQGTGGDYMTFFVVTAGREYWMGGRASRPTIQFSLWTDDSSPLDATRMMELWCVWLDREPGDPLRLDVAGGHQLMLTRETDAMILRDPDGGWHIFVTYSMLIDEV